MKRSLSLPLVLAAGVGFILACGGGDGTAPKRMERNAGKEGYSAHYDGDCLAMAREFTADAAAATEKYRNKTVFLTGTVKTEITRGVVTLDGGGTDCAATPHKGSAAKEAKAFTKGGKAEFLCSFDKFEASVAFKDCSPYTQK